jgi:acetyltransferase-like isoleucine patch superfamily enzyme
LKKSINSTILLKKDQPLFSRHITYLAMAKDKKQLQGPTMPLVKTLFDVSSFAHRVLFEEEALAWEPLKGLKDYLLSRPYPAYAEKFANAFAPLTETMILHQDQLFTATDHTIEFGDATKDKLKVYKNDILLEGATVLVAGSFITGRQIDIGQGVLIESGAYVKGPVIIGDQTEVRQGAYLRGNCLVGSRCVVGHTTEIKHAIFLDDAKAGHFAYIGDSILGNDVNLGAGTKLANLKFARGNVKVRTENDDLDTGLGKLGAIMGDRAQTGCNAVTNPGTVLGAKAIILPNTTAPSGYHARGKIIR